LGPILKLHGNDGDWLSFRPLDREMRLAGDPSLRGTLAGRFVQDRGSALHPVGPVVAAELLAAVGVASRRPRLVAIPDVPELGVLREEFAGMVGLVEEHRNEAAGVGDSAGGAVEMIRTEDLIYRLQEDPQARADARGYLAARLMDLYLAGLNPDLDGWHWVRHKTEDGQNWRPVRSIPGRVFMKQDGLLRRIEKRFLPEAMSLDAAFGRGVSWLSSVEPLDRRLLAELPYEVWDSVSSELRSRLTDQVIDGAVLHLPSEFDPLDRMALAATLRTRRSQLEASVDRFYASINSDVEVHGTNQRDLVLVERWRDGAVEVRLFPLDPNCQPQRAARFSRRIPGGVAREIRIFLHDGDDRAVIYGDAARGPLVRLIAGEGDDVLIDSARVSSPETKTVIHDVAMGDSLLLGPHTVVADGSSTTSPYRSDESGGPTWQESGSERRLRPSVDYHSAVGVVLGVNASYVRYGFRQHPFAYRMRMSATYSPREQDFGIGLQGEFHRAGSADALLYRAEASRIGWIRFYGFGNDSREDPEMSASYDVAQDEYLLEGLLRVPLTRFSTVALGPTLRYTRPKPDSGSVFATAQYFGRDPFGQIGAVAELRLDRREPVSSAERGILLETRGSFYPATWNVAAPFGNVRSRATGYLPLALPLNPILVLGAGGEKVWGQFPVQEAAFLGGSTTLPGYRAFRYAGDAAVYGRAAVRANLGQINLLVRGDLGAFVLADAGRVFSEGKSPGGWHTDAGGGLLFLFRLREHPPFAVSITLVHGERDRVFVKAGLPF
jgi:hypothetical protein